MENSTAKSRLVGIRLAALTLRLMENWRRIFPDYDSALIAIAIVVIMAERLMRADLEPDLESLELPMPTERLAKCNISSIAAATGFNRETTRRKVDALVRAGIVVREGRSIMLAPGFTQQDFVISQVQMQLEQFRRTRDDLERMGVLPPYGSD